MTEICPLGQHVAHRPAFRHGQLTAVDRRFDAIENLAPRAPRQCDLSPFVRERDLGLCGAGIVAALRASEISESRGIKYRETGAIAECTVVAI